MVRKLIKTVVITYLITISIFTQAQTKLPGLFAYDATYYYQDMYGIEWIGTGSSGGIFFKHNNVWKACNDPFGPGHIYWIGELNNKLYVRCDADLFVFNRKKFKWKKLLDSGTIDSLKSYVRSMDSLEVNNLIKRFNRSKIRCPKKTNAIFSKDSNTIIFCTVKGLIYYDRTKKTYTKADIRIQAADVFKVICNHNKELFCLTQDDKIWKYKSNNWNLITDFSPKYNSEEEFYLLDLTKIKKNYMLLKPYNLLNKERSFAVSRDKILQLEGEHLHILDLEKDTILNLNVGYLDNIFDVQIKNDTIIFIRDLKILNNHYFVDYIQTKLVDDKLVKLCQQRKRLQSDGNHGLYPMILDNPRVSSLIFTYNGYYKHENSINKKILSFYMDENKMFLGTYGSGVIEVDIANR